MIFISGESNLPPLETNHLHV
uniref:Uncharacterized protein n=1 Tax=Anguilla anguilla TaxID=7936 RepID=A0A0E9VC58_ANGAN